MMAMTMRHWRVMMRVNPSSDEFDTAIGGLAPGGGWPKKIRTFGEILDMHLATHRVSVLQQVEKENAQMYQHERGEHDERRH